MIRVCQHIHSETGLVTTLGKCIPGIVQMNFGVGAKQGNMQLYVSKFGRTLGNLRLNIGCLNKLKETRHALMHSPWFVDALPGATARQTKAHFQKDGSAILPPISIQTPVEELKNMLSTVAKKLKGQGRKAMQKYLKESQLPADCEAEQLLTEAFGVPVVKQESQKDKKRKRPA